MATIPCPQDLSPTGGTSWSLDSGDFTSLNSGEGGFRAERGNQAVHLGWAGGHGGRAVSTRDRAGEGAEVWAFSAETCAGLGVTNTKVAQSDLHFRKLFLAAAGLCWARQRGPGCPQLRVWLQRVSGCFQGLRLRGVEGTGERQVKGMRSHRNCEMGQGLSWRDGQEVGEVGEAREGRLQGWWCSGHGEVQED